MTSKRDLQKRLDRARAEIQEWRAEIQEWRDRDEAVAHETRKLLRDLLVVCPALSIVAVDWGGERIEELESVDPHLVAELADHLRNQKRDDELDQLAEVLAE